MQISEKGAVVIILLLVASQYVVVSQVMSRVAHQLTECSIRFKEVGDEQ